MADTETFQHYQVLKKPDGKLWELGRGAMGVTYKAFDTNLRCNVALKVINAAYLDSDMARQRFLREARAAAGLSHPNVASVFHLGEEGGNYFYAMEFIDGETLEAFVRRTGPLPPILALKIAVQVANALRAAAREGLVHRDIKPANLMLLQEDEEEGGAEERHVKVIDFGLAKVTRQGDGEASATITVAGFVGTPHFASPEQLEEKDLDVRSDMYSLGVTLWYMLTGRPTFAGSLVQIMSQHLTRPPAFENLKGQPPEVVHLLEHLLEKDPAMRPQTPSDLRREIEQAIASLSARAVAHAPDGAEVDPGSYQTEAATGDVGLASDQPLTSPPPATGVVLDSRYRLLQEVAQGPTGTLFQALELDTGRPVALRVFPAGFFATGEALEAAQRQTDKARLAPHPNLLQIFGLERLGVHTGLIYEWVNGFALVDVLRSRHELAVGETLQLLEPLAAAVDHAQASGLADLDFSPAKALLAFEATVDLPTRTALLAEPLSSWPAFRPKLFPLSFSGEPGASATWAGLQTMLPASPAAPGAARQVARLAYELLGGVIPAAGAPQRFAPLPALTEEGNAVLQDALDTGEKPAFARAGDFVRALATAAGPTPLAMPTAAPRARTAPVAPAPMPRSTPPAVKAVAPVLPPAPPPLPVAVPPPVAAVPAGAAVPPSPVATAPTPAKSGRGLMVALSVGVLFILLAGLGGVSFFAWKVYSSRIAPRIKAIARNDPTPSPQPTSAPPVATPTPPPATPTPGVTPTPTAPTPAPTPSRDAQFKDALAQATRLENAGDDPAALSAYVKLAEDYPDLDPGASRVESYISALRGREASSSPEIEQRRFAGLREPMERAAKLGSSLAMLYLGAHLSADRPEEAAKWYQQAADRGEPEAMVELGNMYFRGRGVPADPAQVSRWYQRASDKGYALAKVYLAECYIAGKGGVRVDYDRAFTLLSEAHNQEPDNPRCLEKLAIAYERGQGTPPDPHQAVTLMKRAADLGNANAMGDLGVYYMKGLDGGKSNARAAADVFKQGADKNNAFCLFNYAQCLEGGLGVRANRAQAEVFYRAAAGQGFPPAQQWCRTNHVSFTAPGQ